MSAPPTHSLPRWAVVAWPALLAVLVLGFTEYRYLQVKGELAMRPPIAVIPVDEVIVGLMESDPDTRAEDAILHTREGGRRLAESGYVVFDAGQIYGYPKDIEARP